MNIARKLNYGNLFFILGINTSRVFLSMIVSINDSEHYRNINYEKEIILLLIQGLDNEPSFTKDNEHCKEMNYEEDFSLSVLGLHNEPSYRGK